MQSEWDFVRKSKPLITRFANKSYLTEEELTLHLSEMKALIVQSRAYEMCYPSNTPGHTFLADRIQDIIDSDPDNPARQVLAIFCLIQMPEIQQFQDTSGGIAEDMYAKLQTQHGQELMANLGVLFEHYADGKDITDAQILSHCQCAIQSWEDLLLYRETYREYLAHNGVDPDAPPRDESEWD